MNKDELFPIKESVINNLKLALVEDFVKARQEKGLSQKKLEKLSGVKQPIIARMEKGYTAPHLDTILKVLAPLGKTLEIVSMNQECLKHNQD